MKRWAMRAGYVAWGVRLALLVPVLVFGYWAILQVRGNFHEVMPNELYRSAQLSPEALSRYIAQYRIRSVINLRGENWGQNWYAGERAITDANHIPLIDFRMSSKRALSLAQSRALIEVMRAAPKPVLVHCRAGADRTGLAVALYLAAVHGVSEMTAELQLSPLYGHLPFFMGAPAMNESFELMEPELGYEAS